MGTLTASREVIQQKRLSLRLIRHHLGLAVATLAAVALLYTTRPYRDWISRASFATAYPALVLLGITLWLGPWNVLRRQRNPVSSDLRRDIGIWAGIVGVAHAVIGQCVHLRGRPWLYYVYEKKSKHAVPLRHDWFGFANYTGLIGALLLIALLATSNDLCLRALGTPRWKSLQRWNYACFGLAAVHTVLYQSNEKLHAPFLIATFGTMVITIVLQLVGLGLRRKGSTAQRAVVS